MCSYFCPKMEEALWNLEDKWKVSTNKAIALFACTSLLVIGVCVAAAVRRRRRQSVHQEPAPERSVVKALMGSVRWSKWEEEVPSALLVKRDQGQSRNSTSGVWQRPILMGEKCELPRYSGLIMYDHKGMPIHQDGSVGHNQEMSPPPVTTTLRELL